MSARYEAVGWNPSKIALDAVFVAAIAVYLLGFMWIAPAFQTISQPLDPWTIRMNAFGTCAFLLMTVILCIGPAARLDRRFLPLVYNRRHLGVMTAGVALTHAWNAIDWYFSFSPTNRFVNMLSGNTSFGQIQGFPFEIFGVVALLILALLAVTSHDFWLNFLTPRVWKTLHMSLYGGYFAVILHIALGALQAKQSPLLAVVVAFSVVLVCGLHVAAGRQAAREDACVAPASDDPTWLVAGPVSALAEGAGMVVRLAGAEAVAIFRHDGRLSAVSNLCAHQNGPLGEGRVIDGCITCPWHGFQYRLEDGCAPAPFTEKLATYRVRVRDGMIQLDPRANAPGTRVEPAVIA